jgi:hypothetical protein
MDLKSFSAMNRVEKEFEVVPGLKISMHTLSVLQQQQTLAELPSSTLAMDTALRAVILQQALLVYAIDSINGQKVTVQEVKDFVQNLQAPIFNAICNCYDLMIQEQDKTLEELKKKVS